MHHSAPTGCKYMVSGTLSLPSTGFFSFFIRTTSFTIGRQGIFSLRRWTSPIHTEFHVLDTTWVSFKSASAFVYKILTFYDFAFHQIPLASTFLTLRNICNCYITIPLPSIHNDYSLTCIKFGLLSFRSPLLRQSISLSLPDDTKMFQFSSFAFMPYLFRHKCKDSLLTGCPIRVPLDQRFLTALQRFSQSYTPFFAS